MGKLENTRLAEETVIYVKRPRGYGGGPERAIVAMNAGELGGVDEQTFKKYRDGHAGSRDELTRAVMEMREIKASLSDKKDGKRSMKVIAKVALASGFGNCQEQAALGFRFLKKERGARCVDVMMCAYTNNFGNQDVHYFLLIGRPEGVASSNVAGWGDDAVVCDPWAPPHLRVYDAGLFPHKMKETLGPFSILGAGARLNAEGKTAY